MKKPSRKAEITDSVVIGIHPDLYQLTLQRADGTEDTHYMSKDELTEYKRSGFVPAQSQNPD